ncbi:MAG: carboxypeptidase-like regulatory domain-containing protein [Gemmatimonadaceae bacterium]
MATSILSGLRLAAATLVLSTGVSAGAQAPRTSAVDVTVTDASGTRLAGVELTLRRLGARDVVSAATDQRGSHRFEVPDDTGALSLVARKIGYAPSAQEFRVDPNAPAAVTIVLARAPATLDTTVIAADIPRSKKYYIGATEIATSSRYIGDALDAVSKLQPAMMGDGYRLCPGVKYIWVNGQRIYSAPIGGSSPRGNRVSAAGVRERPVSSGNVRDQMLLSTGPPGVADVLASIHAEHLAEIRYVNCWDKPPLPGVGGSDALFIVLKPGVQWDWKRGSRVVDSTLFRTQPN